MNFLIQLLIRLLVFITPIVLALILAPSRKWAPGMSFDTWFKKTADCELGTPACDLTSSGVCWSCDFFGKLIDFFSDALEKAFSFMNNDLITLILFGTAIWFAWFTLSQLKAEGEPDGKAYLKKVVRRMGRVLIVIFLLGGAGKISETPWMKSVVQGVVEPIFSVHSGLVQSILNIPKDYCPKAPESDSILGSEIKTALLCTNGMMGLLANGGLQASGNMMSLATKLDGKLSWLGGAYMYGTFLLFLIMVPFLLLDILISIIIPLFFFPLILTSYAFESAHIKQHLQTAISIIIKGAFKMVAISIGFVFIYAIFIAVGDKYLPGPVDNFSYVFPDYMKRTKTDPSPLELEFKKCYAMIEADYAPEKLAACAKRIPSLESSGSWTSFLLLMGVLQVALTLFQKIYKKIYGLVSGNELTIGNKIYDAGEKIVKDAGSAIKSFVFKKFKI